MALLILAAALALVAAVPANGQASVVMGGASSIRDFAVEMNTVCPDSAPYASVGSGLGVDNFNSGKYVVGTSDQPMTKAEEATGISASLKKCTIPLVLARYGFFVKTTTGADGVLKLTPVQTYTIFKSGGNWATYKYPALVTGAINRVARSDGSGTTFTIKLYWVAAKTPFIREYPSALNSDPLPFGGLDLQSGTSAVCTRANAVTGSITYAQVGVCDKFGKLTEVSLLNKAKKFVLPSTSDANAAAPRSPPKNCVASWSTVGSKMVFAAGPKTAPIASFVYGFIRAKGLASAGPLGAKGKAALTCYLQKGGGIAKKYAFTPIPSKYRVAALAAVKSTKA